MKLTKQGWELKGSRYTTTGYLLLLVLLCLSLVVPLGGCASASVAPDTGKSSPSAQTESTPQIPKLKVHYIDVGQGDSILIQVPNGKNMLIDAGTREESSKLLRYLKDQGIKKLDIVIGTHPHEDHIGSLDSVINTFDVGQVVLPKVTANTETYRDLLRAISNKGLKITVAKAGLALDLGSGVSAELLAPNSKAYEDINNYSAVMKLIYGKNSFLFTGDAQAESEQEMIKVGYDLQADVLKVGHHGSHTSTSAQFLTKVNPRFAVISCGKGNSYGHPHRETLDKLAKAKVKVYRTDLDGTIVAESDGTNITFSHN